MSKPDTIEKEFTLQVLIFMNLGDDLRDSFRRRGHRLYYICRKMFNFITQEERVDFINNDVELSRFIEKGRKIVR